MNLQTWLYTPDLGNDHTPDLALRFPREADFVMLWSWCFVILISGHKKTVDFWSTVFMLYSTWCCVALGCCFGCFYADLLTVILSIFRWMFINAGSTNLL
jgi:hypothetical protein